ncbi:hypothetical protein ASwh1_131 [Aeromonas phage Aswh_1]|nr:hypothetical protein ASwh1_131 [Aeromonas phage Aswh_1]
MIVYQKISDTLEKYVDVSIPVDKIKIIYGNETKLLSRITKFGLDTWEREEILDILSQFFLRCDWPTNGDCGSINFNDYHNRLLSKISKEGFTK